MDELYQEVNLTIIYLTKVIQSSVTIIALTLFIEIVDKELLKYEVENSRLGISLTRLNLSASCGGKGLN